MRQHSRGGGPSRTAGALVIYAALVALALAVALHGVPGAIAAQIRARPPLSAAVPATSPTDLEIAQGASAVQIVAQLAKAGVVHDPEALRALLDFGGLTARLQAGRYRFAADLPPAEVARILAAGPNRSQAIALREGLRNEEVGDLLERAGVASRAEWDAALAAPHDAPFLAVRPDGASLLGYLLPATYAFDAKTTAAGMAQAMLDAFGKQVTPELVAAAQADGLTLHEVLTLASIVEREAAVPAERPVIAAVFRNRLAQEVPLQADPTVQFAVAQDPASVDRSGYWKSGLTVEDLAIDSPYNTYLYPGLPPGPIANPGIGAIRAVAHPAAVDYLYFVAAPACDGTHLFASTLAAHNANVARFNASACAEGA